MPAEPTTKLSPKPPEPPPSRHWVLCYIDQCSVAAILVVALVAMIGWWHSQGGWQGRLLEVEQTPSRVAAFSVDLNEAAWPELIQLPGIGPTLAQRIVDSRAIDGPFLDHADLRRIRGIGPKTLEKLRPFLRPMPESGSIAEN